MEPNTGTALALLPTAASASPYDPRSYQQAQLMAADFAGSKLTKCRSKEQALLVMATGHELGIPATTALRMIYVADFGQGDQVTLSADLMVALCLRAKVICEYFRCQESTDERAVYATRRKGDPERTATFTMEDARRAKLGSVGAGKDAALTNWAKYPAMMLRHRAASILAREVYPDVIGGFYTDDEAREVAASAPGARPVIDAEFSEPAPVVEETPEARAARWTAAIRAAGNEDAIKPIVEEIGRAYPDKNAPERKAMRELVQVRKAAKWVVEPTHDAATGEVTERQPGEDDA